MPKGPDVTQSASVSGRQTVVREGRLNVPLHIVPYRVEGCISGRHVVGAALASRRGSKVDYNERDWIAHERDSRSLTSLLEDRGQTAWQRMFAYARSSNRRDCLHILGQTSSNALQEVLPEGRDVPSGVARAELADGGREVRRARIARSRLSAQAGRQAVDQASSKQANAVVATGWSKVWAAHATSEGAGVRLHRAMLARAEVVAGKGEKTAVEHGERKLTFVHLQHQPQHRHRHRRAIAFDNTKLDLHMAHVTAE